MKAQRVSRRRGRSLGFSIVELMVASAAGLIVVLAVIGSVLTTARQSSVVSANLAAQASAQIALSLLDTAGRAAGAGFYNGGRFICRTWNAWNGSIVVSNGAVLMPARIIAGGSSTVADKIVFTGATGTRPLSVLPVLSDSSPGANLKISGGADLVLADLAVIGVPGSDQPCTLFQVTAAPSASTSGCSGNASTCNILIRAPNHGLNPSPAAFTTDPTFGFTNSGSTHGPAVVSRVGSMAEGFRQEGFGVQCNALVRYNAFQTPVLPACTAAPLAFGSGVDAIAMGVVMLRAQYGVSDMAASDVVTAWVAPAGLWAAPTADDVARIKAVRVVVVVRAAEPEGAQVSAGCTNAAGVVNTGPCSFQDAAAPVIDLSAVTVAAGKTWRNYRYRVHTAVIPLRNVIWSDS